MKLYETTIVRNGFGDKSDPIFLGNYTTHEDALQSIIKYAKTFHSNEYFDMSRSVLFGQTTIIDFGSGIFFGQIEEFLTYGEAHIKNPKWRISNLHEELKDYEKGFDISLFIDEELILDLNVLLFEDMIDATSFFMFKLEELYKKDPEKLKFEHSIVVFDYKNKKEIEFLNPFYSIKERYDFSKKRRLFIFQFNEKNNDLSYRVKLDIDSDFDPKVPEATLVVVDEEDQDAAELFKKIQYYEDLIDEVPPYHHRDVLSFSNKKIIKELQEIISKKKEPTN